MTYAMPLPRFDDRNLAWGLVLSIVVHGVALTLVQWLDTQEQPPVLFEVKLQPPPPPPEPPKVVTPQPKPEPQPEPKPRPKPEPRLEPKPQPLTPEPRPEPESPRVETPPPPPPPVMTAAPRVEEPPVRVIPVPPPPPPEPPKPVGPTQQELDQARGLYSGMLSREFAKHRQYPRMAQMRNWQGTVQVRLEVNATGQILASQISESSGFEVLDKQALDMVKKAAPLPLPPEVLRGRQFTLLVPVVFRLE